MLVALRTGYIDEQFAPLVRAVKSLNGEWSKFQEMKELCTHIKQLYYDILTTFQRDVSLLPPLVTSRDQVLLPEPDKIARFWNLKYNAYVKMKRQQQVAVTASKEVYDGLTHLSDGINNAITHFEEFALWAELPTAPKGYYPGGHSIAFLVSNYGPQPTTPEEIQKAWHEIRWSGYISTYKMWMEEGITKAKKALKDFIVRGVNYVDLDKESQGLFASGIEKETGATPTKKGEKWALVAQIPRGGNVCGFLVVNQVGVHQTIYEEMAHMLNSVRQILSRRGLSNATNGIPIVYRGISKAGGTVKVIDTGVELGVAGRYHPSGRYVEILFDDLDYNAMVSSCNKHYPPDMVSVLLHEIGHYYYFNRLSASARGQHDFMFKRATSFPSSYAKNNPAEDFAELWTAYLGRGYTLNVKAGNPGANIRSYTMTSDCWERFKAVVAADPKLKEIGNMVAEAQENDWESRLQEMVVAPKEMWEAELKRFLSLRAEVNERKDLQGERHFGVKLSAKDVVLIRKAATAGFPQNRLAEAFEVSRTTISQIVNYQKWKHL